MEVTPAKAWAQAYYNPVAISIENEGYPGDSLTDGQLNACAEVLAWAHDTFGVLLQVTDDPNGSGLITHGLLGQAGGGHYDCPGDPIRAQRGAIVSRASALVKQPAPPKGVTMLFATPLHIGDHSSRAWVFPPDGSGVYDITPDGHIFALVKPGTQAIGNAAIGSMPAGQGYWGTRTVLNAEWSNNALVVTGTFNGTTPDGVYTYARSAPLP